ncbi:60S ribosomal protein L19 [Lemmus lemmus]
MNMFRLQKRLASGVHHHGKKEVWLDPNETHGIANANFHQQIQKLTKNELIIQRPVTVHSWAQCQKNTLAQWKGGHIDTGKRKGAASAHRPEKVTWLRRMQVLASQKMNLRLTATCILACT